MNLIRPIIYLLINPVVIGLILMIFGFLIGKYNGNLLLSKVLWQIGGLWFFLLIFTPLPYILLGKLEHKFSALVDYPSFKDSPRIMVLANDFNYDPYLPPSQQLGEKSMLRLVEALNHLEAIDIARLVISGPRHNINISQAEVAKNTAIGLGYSENRIELIEDADNTFMEAEEYNERYNDGKPLILVTSASHMNRAVEIFRSKGIEVIPAPTNFTFNRGRYSNKVFVPGFKGINHMALVIRESLGTMYAKYFQEKLEKRKAT